MNMMDILALDPITIAQNPREENIKIFEDIFSSFVTRDGADKLFEFIKKSDYYKAPASTRFHSHEEGGLLLHSLLVMWCLLHKRNNPVWAPSLSKYTDETLILVSLCHDLCKTYFYSPTWKNQKVYSEHGSKSDAGGKYDWETVQGWEIDDKYPLGHGEKSCYFLTKYVDLSVAEYAAVRWHMGFSEPKDVYSAVGESFSKYPITLALNEADLEASKLYEKE